MDDNFIKNLQSKNDNECLELIKSNINLFEHEDLNKFID